jgi:hypothetical protein
MSEMVDLLTEAEVAQILRCSPKTVARRKLAHVRNGRLKLYERKEVEDFICRAKRPAEPPSPQLNDRKAVQPTGRRGAKSRSVRETVQLAQDELSAALAMTAKLRGTGKRSARRGTRNTRSVSEIPASS